MDGLDQTVGLLRAAGDPTRLRILLALGQRPLCVCELVALVDVGQPAVSRHLGILQRAGLVDSARDGWWVVYRLADPPPSALARRLCESLAELAAADPSAAALLDRAAVVDRRQLGAAEPRSASTCNPKIGARR